MKKQTKMTVRIDGDIYTQVVKLSKSLSPKLSVNALVNLGLRKIVQSYKKK